MTLNTAAVWKTDKMAFTLFQQVRQSLPLKQSPSYQLTFYAVSTLTLGNRNIPNKECIYQYLVESLKMLQRIEYKIIVGQIFSIQWQIIISSTLLVDFIFYLLDKGYLTTTPTHLISEYNSIIITRQQCLLNLYTFIERIYVATALNYFNCLIPSACS